MIEEVRHRAKALAAAALTAAAVYVSQAVIAHQALTLNGLYAALAGAVLAGVGVHQTTNAPKPK